jgi:hypothetical protein
MIVSRTSALAAVAAVVLPAVASCAARSQSAGTVRPWPCRIVVERPLLQVVEDAWEKSGSFRQQCGALAERRAVAALTPGRARTGSLALTRITTADDGVVVGRVEVPLGLDALEYIAHELEHVLERAEGADLPAQSASKDSGVWMALDGYETQRAIDRGRQVAREVRESSRAAR